MRNIIYIAIIFSVTSCSNTDKTSSKTSDNKVIKQYLVDLNGDNSIDTITLTDPELSGDPGVFKKISITGKNIEPFELKAKYSWDAIPELFYKKENAINSDLVYVKRHLHSSYIMLAGHLYGTGLEDFALIAISDNKSKLLTKKEFNDVSLIADLNNDNHLDIVLNPTWSEGIGTIDSLDAGILSYAPYYVYSLNPDTLKLDTTLTRTYNQQNYTWAGLKDIKDIFVIYYHKTKTYEIWEK
jgi:hypothetical protein